jgi:hypothetical protein
MQDDIQEHMDEFNEVSNALSGGIGADMFDDEELLNELDDIEEEQGLAAKGKSALREATGTTTGPAAPAPAVAVAAQYDFPPAPSANPAASGDVAEGSLGSMFPEVPTSQPQVPPQVSAEELAELEELEAMLG